MATIADLTYSLDHKDVMVNCDLQVAAAVCLNFAPDVINMMSHPPLIREIVDSPLWIGPSAVLDDPRSVCDRGIEAVVCVAPEPLPQRWPRDLTYIRVPLSDDGENAAESLHRAVEITSGLITGGVPTLTVCSMGHSRSIAIAAAAIAACEGAAPDDVLRRITAQMPADISPALWDSLKRIG